MSQAPSIVILTNVNDPTADYFEQRLRERSLPFLRINTDGLLEEFSITGTPTLADGLITKNDQRFSTACVRGIWNRRPVQPKPPSYLSPDEARLASRELMNSLWGMFLGHPGRSSWINTPDALVQADYKIEQLRRARHYGLAIPETLLSSDIAEVASFVQRHRLVIAKAAYEGYAEIDGRRTVTWTSLINTETLEGLTLIPIPMIFQEAITPKKDVRVTVIDRKCWVAQIKHETNGTMTELDWRAAASMAKSSPGRVDPSIEVKLQRLVESYGLRFAAIDLAVARDGTAYFLELNANGQWGWLEVECGFPLRDALIDALVRD